MGFEDFSKFLEDSPFDETPVDAKTFVESSDYLAQPPLSKIQYDIVESMAQIYKQEDVERVLGVTEGRHYFTKYTKGEIIMALGKGSIIGSTKCWSPEFGWKRVDSKLEDYGLIQSGLGVHSATAFYSEGEDDVFRVTTKFGYSFTGNAKHRLWGWKNSKHGFAYATRNSPEMFSLSELEKGDIAAIVGEWDEPINPYDATPDEARLIGYMIGDGTWVRNGRHGNTNPLFTNNTGDVQKDFVRIVESLGGSVVETESGFGCWKVRVNGLNDWFVKHGLVHDYGEKKPWNDSWMNMSNECLGALLNGVWATDGWGHIQTTTFKGKERKGLHVALETNSESIMSGIHMALLRLGVFSSLRKNRGTRGSGKHAPTWRISITNPHFINKFVDAVGYPVGKEECFFGIENVSRNKTVGTLEKHGPVYRDRIESIEYVGKQEVFSCTVETGHNYLGGGFVHGNSGKDHTSTIGVAYVVYKLLCLKDPAKYYGKPPGDAIDIINIAINAQQARNVFFKGFKHKIERSPWFREKFYSKMDSIEFKKSITVYSGHSERESHEGLNLFMAILDEISGFGENAANSELGKSGANIYKAFRGTVDSRFPDYGKVVLLSFTRHEGDFISKKYDEAIAEKDVVQRTHEFIVNPDLPKDYPGNTFSIEWTEDHITKYTMPRVFALKRPTWEVNPTRSIEDFKIAFYTDPADAKMRFLCQPTVSSDAFFRDKDKIRNAMGFRNPMDESRRVDETWKPDPDKQYFVHADLAQLVDKCAVAVAHVEKWVNIEVMNQYTQTVPIVVVDMIAWWEPSKHGPVNLSDVKNWIVSLRRRGVNLGLVTFDRWNCLPADSVLLTQDGPRSIASIAPGDTVATAAGQETVSNVFDNGVRDVYKITTKLGYSIRGTSNHPVMTKGGYKQISELAPGDEVAIKASGVFGSENLDEDLAWALGLIIGDGWMEANRLVVDGIDKETLLALQDILSTRFSYTKSDIKIKNKATDKWNECYRLSFTSKEFGKFISDNYPSIKNRSAERVIEPIVLNGDRDTQVAFIGGLIEAEGAIQQYGSDRRVDIEMTSPIVEWLHLALLNLGVTSSLTSRERAPFAKSYRVSAKGDRGNALLEMITLVSDRKKKARDSYLSVKPTRKPRWALDESGVAWLPIKSKEFDGAERVYDICVPGSHSFVANGFVTHNSFDIQQELREVGIRSETLSVAKKHYEDLAMLVYEDRIALPSIELLLQEMTELKVVNDKKVDHPRKGSKDLSDAMTGAVFNAISRTPRVVDQEIEVHTWSRGQMPEAESAPEPPPLTDDAREYLMNFGLL